MSTILDEITEKLAQGRSLHHDDALALWECRDLVSLGMLADEARRRRHGDVTTFLRVATVSLEEASGVPIATAAGEIRVTGTAAELLASGSVLQGLVARAGATPVTAGTLEEFERLADSPAALRALLETIRRAGLYAIASAGVDKLADPEGAVRVLGESGLALGRLVVEEPPAGEPWPILERVQRIQAANPAIRTFAPVPRAPDPLQPTTGYSDVKWVAIARLALHGLSSVQVDWALHGPKLAQVALLFGADDVDAVSAEDDGGAGRRRAPLEEIRRNIRAASLTAVERDARFTRRSA